MAKRLGDLDVAGQRVLVRVDFNVPLDAQGRVTSDARISAAKPTIERLLTWGARPVLASHLGRPEGKRVDSLSLRAVANHLDECSRFTVRFAPDCVGDRAESVVEGLGDGEVCVLENLRFYAEETRGDEAFGRRLASLAEAYVLEAFGTAHRPHASVAVVPRFLPSAMGILVEKELDAFHKVLVEPTRPLVAVLGGAKVSDKLPVIRNLLARVDRLLIGGAMAYTFLEARGVPVGASRVEEDLLGEARSVLDEAERAGTCIELPCDHVGAVKFEEDSPYEVTGESIPDGLVGLDIGPKTRETFALRIADAGTLVWNGPMGVFEWEEFARGTARVAEAVAACPGFTVVGGGDSVAALEKSGLAAKVDHVSTGGGACLALLEGRTLPGVAALESSPA